VTEDFPLDVVLSLASGSLVCNSFSDVHGLAEYLMDQPIFTHQLASITLVEEMQAELARQHPWLVEQLETLPDFSKVPKPYVENACRGWVHQVREAVGMDVVPIARITNVGHVPFATGLPEKFGGTGQ
jgi:hypothetical protein